MAVIQRYIISKWTKLIKVNSLVWLIEIEGEYVLQWTAVANWLIINWMVFKIYDKQIKKKNYYHLQDEDGDVSLLDGVSIRNG